MQREEGNRTQRCQHGRGQGLTLLKACLEGREPFCSLVLREEPALHERGRETLRHCDRGARVEPDMGVGGGLGQQRERRRCVSLQQLRQRALQRGPHPDHELRARQRRTLGGAQHEIVRRGRGREQHAALHSPARECLDHETERPDAGDHHRRICARLCRQQKRAHEGAYEQTQATGADGTARVCHRR